MHGLRWQPAQTRRPSGAASEPLAVQELPRRRRRCRAAPPTAYRDLLNHVSDGEHCPTRSPSAWSLVDTVIFAPARRLGRPRGGEQATVSRGDQSTSDHSASPIIASPPVPHPTPPGSTPRIPAPGPQRRTRARSARIPPSASSCSLPRRLTSPESVNDAASPTRRARCGDDARPRRTGGAVRAPQLCTMRGHPPPEYNEVTTVV